MNTRNWQIKMLTLCMAAFALFLTAACGDEYTGPQRITPSAPCGDADYETLLPSREFRSFAVSKFTNEETRRRVQNQAAEDRAERLLLERIRVRAILRQYVDRIRKQYVRHGGYVHGFGLGALSDENGIPTDRMVIEIWVTKYVDQITFLPEDRIPECMEGVPVHFQISPQVTIE